MRITLGLLLALAIASPAAAGIKVDVPPAVIVPALEAGAQVQAVSFSRFAMGVAEGQTIAEVGDLFSCALGGVPIHWHGDGNEAPGPTYERIFREEFAKAGLTVSGDQTNIFERDTKNSDLQVGALLTDLQAKICYGLYAAYAGGSGIVKVEWQIYSVSGGKVIARIPTVAGISDLRARNHTELLQKIVQKSFAENVRALTANSEFRAIVLGPRHADSPVNPFGSEPLRVAYSTSDKPTTISDAATGAVLIFAGSGSGSGALISADGYILTNYHVAGDAGRVRIRWSDGSESVGEVVRGDRRRDVALIKVAAPRGRPLTIRLGPVDLGEVVFAIGTPLDPKLQNSITRGGVSALRVLDGESFIQSDTPVTHGNSGGPLLDAHGAVVGLTDLGLDPSLGSSINFFIPINDALKVLGLQPSG